MRLYGVSRFGVSRGGFPLGERKGFLGYPKIPYNELQGIRGGRAASTRSVSSAVCAREGAREGRKKEKEGRKSKEEKKEGISFLFLI